MTKYYVPMVLTKEVEVLGKKVKLPEGQWLLPAFESMEAAVEFSPDAQVITVTTRENP